MKTTSLTRRLLLDCVRYLLAEEVCSSIFNGTPKRWYVHTKLEDVTLHNTVNYEIHILHFLSYTYILKLICLENINSYCQLKIRQDMTLSVTWT